MSRLSELENDAKLVGMTVSTYSPGDGVTRYRFFRIEDKSTYFGPANGIHTVLGLGNAEEFLAGAHIGYGRARHEGNTWGKTDDI